MDESDPPGLTSDPPDLTAVLHMARNGEEHALDILMSATYDQLKHLAQAQRQRWDGDYTLNTTALVHEAYLKLVRQDQVAWEDRVHFMRVASTAMRHVLVNYAERRRTQKRGGGAVPVRIDQANPVAPEAAEEILHLNDALKRMEEHAERQSRVVECRFFGGLTVKETATALGISEATVHRDWVVASSWLRRELGPAGPEPDADADGGSW
jgi:RNA polymerase sigma factor (TIGR02999 family)